MTANKIAAGNAGWPFQLRFAVHAGWSRVPEIWMFLRAEATAWKNAPLIPAAVMATPKWGPMRYAVGR